MSQSNMDPFDEFEFKPLTEGLGFHKKAVSLKEGLKNSGVLSDELTAIPAALPKNLGDQKAQAPAGATSAAGKKHTFEDVLSALEKTPLTRPSELTFTETLPRESKRSAMDVDLPRSTPTAPPVAPVQSPFPRPEAYKTPVPGTTAVPAGLKKTPKQDELASVGTRRGAADSPQRRLLDPATMSVPSAFLDFVIVLAMSLVFLVALLMVTKVDLNVVLRNLSHDMMTQLSLGLMFIAVMQMYVVIARSFFGATIGEWTFDLQVGEDGEQKQESYPLRVVFRSVLVTVTGLVFLPLLSAILNRDIAGSLSGVKLYRQRV